MPADPETRGDPEVADRDDARDALSRVLASEGFATSPQLQRILGYIIEEHLAGRADQIKAYSIAVDAMDRPSTFDPQSDPAVRVEMRRLRLALDIYYAKDGSDDPLRIEIPKGSYQPVLSRVSDTPDEQAEKTAASPRDPDPDTGLPRRVSLPVAAAFAVLVGLGIAGLLFLNSADRAARSSRSLEAPIVDVMPFGAVPDTDNGIRLAAGIRHQLIADLSHFRTMRVRDRAIGGTQDRRRDNLVAADYRLTGSVLKARDRLRVTVALAEIATRQLVWSETLHVQANDAGFYDLMVKGVHSIVANVASPAGLLQSQAMKRLDQRLRQNGNAKTSSYECLVLFHAYDLRKDKSDETAARSCLTRITGEGSQNSSIWAAYAFMLFLDWTRLKDQSDQSLLDPALGAARKAIRLDPSDAAGHEYLGSILMAQGKRGAAMEAIQRALERNPSKPDLHILLGWHTVLGGDWEGGMSGIRRGVSMSPAPSGWMRIPLSVDAFRRDDFREALRQAEAILYSGDSRGNVLALASAIRLGDEKLVEKYKTAFLADGNADPANPMKEIRSVFNSPQILQRYTDTLVKVLAVTN